MDPPSETLDSRRHRGRRGRRLVFDTRAASANTGLVRSAVTGTSGQYVISGLEVDVYRVSAVAIGYRPEAIAQVRVTLSTTSRADFTMAKQVVQLQEIVATAPPGTGEFAPTRTGAQTFVSDSLIRRLPSLNRQLQDFVRLTPQVTISSPSSQGTISIAGQNNRYNGIQVDGTDQNDRFGLGTTGELGGQASGRGITIEAVKEYDVVLAPYNVTQGGFTGGLINAVTKNGTNTLAATGFYSYRNQGIASLAPLIHNSQFSIKQYGGSLGGPIIKDKLHFFVAGELNSATRPASGPYLGQSTAITPQPPIDSATYTRFLNALNTYGIKGGSAGLINDQNPIGNAVARIDWTLSDKSRLVFREIYDNSKGDDFSRSASTFNLSSNQFRRAETDNSLTAQWFRNFANGGNNEFQLGYIRQRFARALTDTAPQIRVFSVPSATGAGTYSLIAGADSNSHINQLDQDFYEFHDDYTFPFKGNPAHLVTIGTRSDLYKVRNAFEQNVFGSWAFNGLTNFENGIASSYAVGVIRNGVDPQARFQSANMAFYLQDQWTVNPTFNLVYGVRAEAPVFIDKPAHTDSVFTNFGRNTEDVPSNWEFSPRVGFNWNVAGKARTQVRGGIGIFAGIPPYVWLSNLFTNSGQGLAQLTCAGGSTAGPAPTFTAADVPLGANPQTCGNGAGLNSGLIGTVNTVDPNYKQAENLRATLGMDHRLPGGITFTFDGTYTKAIEAPFMQNLAICNTAGGDATAPAGGGAGCDPTSTGLGGRQVYGTISLTGVSTPNRKLPNIYSGGVYDLENSSSDYAYGAAFTLRKRFTGSVEASASYSYQRSFSVQDFTSSVAASNFNFGREFAGRLDDKTTTMASAFDQPNHVVVSVTYTAPWKKYPTDISVFYQGFSGPPFTYTYGSTGAASGDLNADGIRGNDPIYIPSGGASMDTTQFVNFTGTVGVSSPTNPARNISRAEQRDSLVSFMNQMPCVNSQAGTIMKPRSCRNPWYNLMDVSIRQSLPSIGGHKLTVQAEMFNFMNWLNSTWGQFRSAGSFQDIFLFTQTGMKADGTPIFRFDPNLANLDTRFPKVQTASNFWQAQFTLRYAY